MDNVLTSIAHLKVYTFDEALDMLGFEYDKYNNLTYEVHKCSCGNDAYTSGFLFIEKVECQKCGKQVLNLFSDYVVPKFLPKELDWEDFNVVGQRHWVIVGSKIACKP